MREALVVTGNIVLTLSTFGCRKVSPSRTGPVLALEIPGGFHGEAEKNGACVTCSQATEYRRRPIGRQAAGSD
jgi:hypothetical protein